MSDNAELQRQRERMVEKLHTPPLLWSQVAAVFADNRYLTVRGQLVHLLRYKANPLLGRDDLTLGAAAALDETTDDDILEQVTGMANERIHGSFDPRRHLIAVLFDRPRGVVAAVEPASVPWLTQASTTGEPLVWHVGRFERSACTLVATRANIACVSDFLERGGDDDDEDDDKVTRSSISDSIRALRDSVYDDMPRILRMMRQVETCVTHTTIVRQLVEMRDWLPETHPLQQTLQCVLGIYLYSRARSTPEDLMVIDQVSTQLIAMNRALVAHTVAAEYTDPFSHQTSIRARQIVRMVVVETARRLHELILGRLPSDLLISSFGGLISVASGRIPVHDLVHFGRHRFSTLLGQAFMNDYDDYVQTGMLAYRRMEQLRDVFGNMELGQRLGVHHETGELLGMPLCVVSSRGADFAKFLATISQHGSGLSINLLALYSPSSPEVRAILAAHALDLSHTGDAFDNRVVDYNSRTSTVLEQVYIGAIDAPGSVRQPTPWWFGSRDTLRSFLRANGTIRDSAAPLVTDFLQLLAARNAVVNAWHAMLAPVFRYLHRVNATDARNREWASMCDMAQRAYDLNTSGEPVQAMHLVRIADYMLLVASPSRAAVLEMFLVFGVMVDDLILCVDATIHSHASATEEKRATNGRIIASAMGAAATKIYQSATVIVSLFTYLLRTIRVYSIADRLLDFEPIIDECSDTLRELSKFCGMLNARANALGTALATDMVNYHAPEPTQNDVRVRHEPDSCGVFAEYLERLSCDILRVVQATNVTASRHDITPGSEHEMYCDVLARIIDRIEGTARLVRYGYSTVEKTDLIAYHRTLQESEQENFDGNYLDVVNEHPEAFQQMLARLGVVPAAADSDSDSDSESDDGGSTISAPPSPPPPADGKAREYAHASARNDHDEELHAQIDYVEGLVEGVEVDRMLAAAAAAAVSDDDDAPAVAPAAASDDDAPVAGAGEADDPLVIIERYESDDDDSDDESDGDAADAGLRRDLRAAARFSRELRFDPEQMPRGDSVGIPGILMQMMVAADIMVNSVDTGAQLRPLLSTFLEGFVARDQLSLLGYVPAFVYDHQVMDPHVPPSIGPFMQDAHAASPTFILYGRRDFGVSLNEAASITGGLPW